MYINCDPKGHIISNCFKFRDLEEERLCYNCVSKKGTKFVRQHHMFLHKKEVAQSGINKKLVPIILMVIKLREFRDKAKACSRTRCNG